MERDDLEYVGFWPRVGAELIDLVLVWCITLPLLFVYYGEHSEPREGFRPFEFVVTFLIPSVLTVVFWVWKQATPGKMAINAKIVDAATGGCPTVAQFIGRYLAGFLSFIPFGLGFFWVFVNPRRQGWHDILAGTVVVRPKRPAQPAAVTFSN